MRLAGCNQGAEQRVARVIDYDVPVSPRSGGLSLMALV